MEMCLNHSLSMFLHPFTLLIFLLFVLFVLLVFLPPLIINHSAKGVLAEAPRFTQPQPLSFNNKTYNTRKLIELPYHHSLSGLTRRYEDSLFNFEFIHAKCVAGLIYLLAADYEDALAAIGDKDKVLAGRLAEFQLFIKQNVCLLLESYSFYLYFSLSL